MIILKPAIEWQAVRVLPPAGGDLEALPRGWRPACRWLANGMEKSAVAGSCTRIFYLASRHSAVKSQPRQANHEHFT